MSKNYRKMYKPQEEEKQTVAEQEAPAVYTGVVECVDKLRVRKSPSLEADVVCIIPNGTELTVYVNGSTEEFYKVRTAEGQRGYCLKSFIVVDSSSDEETTNG